MVSYIADVGAMVHQLYRYIFNISFLQRMRRNKNGFCLSLKKNMKIAPTLHSQFGSSWFKVQEGARVWGCRQYCPDGRGVSREGFHIGAFPGASAEMERDTAREEASDLRVSQRTGRCCKLKSKRWREMGETDNKEAGPWRNKQKESRDSGFPPAGGAWGGGEEKNRGWKKDQGRRKAP